MKTLITRFINYTKIDTQSDEFSPSCPSTEKQLNLARLLEEELRRLNLQHIELDHNGYVMAELPANINTKVPVIGFIAHMDTSPDMSGKDVNPRFIENYDGKDILLNNEKKIILSPNDFPELTKYKGLDLITTDGTTLLGADNKAGIAEIMSALEYLIQHPEIKHGTVKICFTPDEEIGRGADHFDVKKFDADFAFTIDGGEIGELEYENFNAAIATINIQGRNVHPGTAKGKMLNAIHMAMELNALLPANERPEFTEGHEGFYHLIDIQGEVEKATCRYIIRDHNKIKFEEKKRFLKECAGLLNIKYGENRFNLEIKDQYFNMKEKIEPVQHIIELAQKAMIETGITPNIKPIRGGTDGARLSYMGLPCPNIFTGGHNFHGKFEFIPVQSMEKAVQVIVKIIELNAK